MYGKKVRASSAALSWSMRRRAAPGVAQGQGRRPRRRRSWRRPRSSDRAPALVKKPRRRLFVLDTNVLMHDPTAIFRFEEHDIFLPMVVIEELDANKKGLSEVGAQRAPGQPLPRRHDARRHQGRDRRRPAHPLLRMTGNQRQEAAPAAGCSSRPARSRRRPAAPCRAWAPTTSILGQTLGAAGGAARRAAWCWCRRTSTCASRRRSSASTPRTTTATSTIEDADVLYTGVQRLPADFWESHGKDMRSWKEGGPHLLRAARPGGRRLAAQRVRARGRRRRHRGHRARHRRAMSRRWS